MKKYGLILSFALHAAVIGAFLVSCEPQKLPPKEELPLLNFGGGEEIADKGGGFTCDRFYIGIGIQTEIGNKVSLVADGYPASQVGIEVGDVILNPDVLFDQQEGVREKVIIQKPYGTRKATHPVPQKICLI